MTKRERQILDWIIQDPMVTQETLAKRAGIARSSVGGPRLEFNEEGPHRRAKATSCRRWAMWPWPGR